jgi:uncharacterized protein (TIGR02757 family)
MRLYYKIVSASSKAQWSPPVGSEKPESAKLEAVAAKSLHESLDALYKGYDFKGRVRHDPIQFPMKYKRKRDIEVSAFIAASFAYGRVDLFMPVIDRVLSIMEDRPYDFVRDFNVGKKRRLFQGIRYRFNDTDDIVCLVYMLSVLLNEYGSVEKAFKRFYSKKDSDVGNALSGMIEFILSINTVPVYGRDIKPHGVLQFFPSPGNRSACKRANLFLRWMIRDRDIDFGIWKGIPKHKLVIPLDAHIARVSRCLGFTRRKSADWKMALEITSALRELDHEDPLKYDFALCHRGISGVCRAENCEKCELKRWSLRT